MRVLNIEDSVYKQNDICKVLCSCKITSIDKADNLEDGLGFIERAQELNRPYDLIITDMWYPRVKGGNEVQSGQELIRIMKEKQIGTPIVVCSSARYNIPEILGCVHYSDRSFWEEDLKEYINQIK